MGEIAVSVISLTRLMNMHRGLLPRARGFRSGPVAAIPKFTVASPSRQVCDA